MLKNKSEFSIKTPYFLIEESELEKNISDLREALEKYWSNYIISYSCKTNSLPWILNYMKNKGVSLEVVSDPEYSLVKNLSVDNSKIIYNGPNKGKEKFYEALQKKSYINIDSENEVEWLVEIDKKLDKKYGIGVRVNFDLAKDCPGETSYKDEGSRFGFSFELGKLKEVIDRVNSLENISVVGVHIHNTTKTRSLRAYESICNCACKIAEILNYSLEYVDIGGGFFGGVPGKTTFMEYMEVISRTLGKKFSPQKTKLIVEPGSALIGSPISFVSEVIDVKDTFVKRIVTINGSRNLVDPFFIKSSYFHKLILKKNVERKIIKEQVVCGYTCLDNDRLMKIENKEELQRGDRIVFEKVGSYTITLSPLFIEYFPDVYVKDRTGKLSLVRKKWEIEEFLQKSIF